MLSKKRNALTIRGAQVVQDRKKVENQCSTCLDCRKYLIFNSIAESHSAFECFEYRLTLSRGGLTLSASDWQACPWDMFFCPIPSNGIPIKILFNKS